MVCAFTLFPYCVSQCLLPWVLSLHSCVLEGEEQGLLPGSAAQRARQLPARGASLEEPVLNIFSLFLWAGSPNTKGWTHLDRAGPGDILWWDDVGISHPSLHSCLSFPTVGDLSTIIFSPIPLHSTFTLGFTHFPAWLQCPWPLLHHCSSSCPEV